MENPTTIAVDLSKNIFEVALERQGRICQRKRLSRRQMTEFFSQVERAVVVMLDGAFLWLRSRDAAEQTLDTEVFVDIGPMNALAVTEQLPVSALGLRRGEQARKPDQGHTDSTAVGKTDDELGGGELDRACLRRATSERSTHATQRLVYRDARLRGRERFRARARGSSRTERARRDRARTLRARDRAARECEVARRFHC